MADKNETKSTEVKGFIMPVTKTVKNGEVVLEVSKADFNKFLDGKGLTKEVREVISKADQEVYEKGFELLNQQITEEKPENGATLKLGQGQGARILTVNPVVQRQVPCEKGQPPKKITVYGECKLKVIAKVPATLETDGGIVDQIAKNCEKIYGSKKK